MNQHRSTRAPAEKAWAYYRPTQPKVKEPFQQPDDLWQEWCATKSPRLKAVLYSHNNKLASKVAHHYSDICEIEFADLKQLADIGLLKAIERFDPGKGNKFSSFAMPWIRGEILHFLRDKGRLYTVPRKAREIKADIVRLHRYLLKGGGDATLEDCAAAKGIPADEWAWICQATEKVPMGELNEAIHIADTVSTAEGDEAYVQLRKAVSKLPNPGRGFLVESFWGGLKTEAIAKKNKQTPEFVEEHLAQAMQSLRNDHVITQFKEA